jgi:hypothetical protein
MAGQTLDLLKVSDRQLKHQTIAKVVTGAVLVTYDVADASGSTAQNTVMLESMRRGTKLPTRSLASVELRNSWTSSTTSHSPSRWQRTSLMVARTSPSSGDAESSVQ